jgi:hypothetical protein
LLIKENVYNQLGENRDMKWTRYSIWGIVIIYLFATAMAG